jgi:hypothetical protein
MPNLLRFDQKHFILDWSVRREPDASIQRHSHCDHCAQWRRINQWTHHDQINQELRQAKKCIKKSILDEIWSDESLKEWVNSRTHVHQKSWKHIYVTKFHQESCLFKYIQSYMELSFVAKFFLTLPMGIVTWFWSMKEGAITVIW